jgi:Ca2+-binding EF-hand superfamily protein
MMSVVLEREAMRSSVLGALGILILLQPMPSHAQRSPWGGPDSPGGLFGGDPMEADGDRDQRVSHDELWTWLRQRLDRQDRDGDGALSLSESRAPRERADAFRAMDADRNGKVTSDELRSASEAWFRSHDGDRDGALTRQEMMHRQPRRPAGSTR